MVNVCFAGITGWTAPAIVAAIDDADDLTLTSGVSRSAAGQSLAAATGSASHGSVYATVAEALESAAVDVLVDFTSAAAVKSNVWTAVEAGVHVVIGSSGLTSDDYEELDRLARDRGVGVIAAGNFSVMAAVLRRAASMAAEHVDRWEIIDYASDDKPDVPSGTSRELAETLAQVREPGGHGGAVRAARTCGGTRRRSRWCPDPLGAAAQLRRHHRSGIRRTGRAVGHAP